MTTNPKLMKLDSLKGQVRTHLADYIGKFRGDTPRGSNFHCINPAHADDDPSCGIVKGNSELFHCFGCDAVGDIFVAANMLEGKPLRGTGFLADNMFYLAKLFGYDVPNLELTADEQHDMDTFRAYAIASQILTANEKLSDRVLAKLQEYDFSEKTTRALGIGSVSSYEDYMRQMTKVYGFDKQFLSNVDLDNKHIFSPDCLVFTVCDEHGSPVGFAARNLLFDGFKKEWEAACEQFGKNSKEAVAVKKKAPPKFVNSEQGKSETELKNRIYQKGTRLFGFHIGRHNAPPLYIFEGYGDCATAYNAGLSNVCAIGSTSFSAEHLNLVLDKGISHVIFVLDADKAGVEGTERFVKLVEEQLSGHVGLKIQIVIMPEGTDDPDAFIRQRGSDAFMALPKEDVFSWRLKQSIKDGDDADQIIESNLGLIMNEENHVKRMRMAEALAKATGMMLDAIWAEVLRRQDLEGQQVTAELTLLADRTAKMLTRTPAKISEILLDSTRQAERVSTLHKGYDVSRLSSYIESIFDTAEAHVADSELKLGWPIFDKVFGGIPHTDTFISIPGKPNQGKALALTAQLKTPKGWKAMRDVQVGDAMASVDGEPSSVTGVFPQGTEKTYRVTFSDGRSVVCSGDHLWAVRFVHQYSDGFGHEQHNGWKVFTTDAIRAFCLNGNRKNSHREVFVPLASGDFGSTELLPIDPWLLGALLGDGGMTACSPSITSVDSHIVKKTRAKVKKMGLDLVLADDRDTFRICRKGDYGKGKTREEKQNPLNVELRKLGLFGSNSFVKFIPAVYLNADKQSRWELLRGLMDTDGTAGKTRETSYATSSPRLAQDVQMLVRSLGGICSISKRYPKFKDKGGQKKDGALCFDLNIRMAERESLFSLPRKTDRVPTAENREPRLTIKTIEFVAEQETQCITVSHPSKLFITSDYIVTHNSSWLANVAHRLVDNNDDVIVLYHTVDDAMRWFLPRLFGSKFGIASEHFYKAGFHLANNTLVKPFGDTDKRRFSDIYNEAKKWLRAKMAAERLLIYDAAMLDQSIFSLEMRVRDIRKKYPTTPIVVFGDNFHLYSNPAVQEEGEAKTRGLSMACKNLANTQHVTLIMTMELPKSALEEGKRPRMINIKGSAGISYDASANIGIYNDKKDRRENADLTWDEDVEPFIDPLSPGQMVTRIRRPVLELVFDKSKVNSGFDGNLYYFFNEASGQVTECGPAEQDLYRKKAARYQEERRNQAPAPRGGANFGFSSTVSDADHAEELMLAGGGGGEEAGNPFDLA